HPFKLTASHGRYLLVNPGLWVRRSRSVKCDTMFSPSGAFPGVRAATLLADRIEQKPCAEAIVDIGFHLIERESA
ncbi:hypothetical protein ONR49_25770, partial [Salmonella enterica subsp. enterica serovar Virginia]|nr:hypothetical protein [Salmonella enterica subsp. enterica serovar Virginia]